MISIYKGIYGVKRNTQQRISVDDKFHLMLFLLLLVLEEGGACRGHR